MASWELFFLYAFFNVMFIIFMCRRVNEIAQFETELINLRFYLTRFL
jgi:hypothetical protein